MAMERLFGIGKYRSVRIPILGVLLFLQDTNDWLFASGILLLLHVPLLHRSLFRLRNCGSVGGRSLCKKDLLELEN